MKKYCLKDYDGTYYLIGVLGEGWTLKKERAKTFNYFSALIWKSYLVSCGFYVEMEEV